ncbi:MAG: hypothetical protein N3B21_06005 [Clostridia bacterium]|nr:hypothetical protein [Clostridia bacterium]
MDDKKELLKLAVQLSEFGNKSTIEKVQQIAKGIYSNELESEKAMKEFVARVGLYKGQGYILSGGKASKESFNDFIENWLKIKCRAGTEPMWMNASLSELSMESFIYVLGWAARITKEKKASKDNINTRQTPNTQKNYEHKSRKDSADRFNKEQNSGFGVSLYEQMNAWKEKNEAK